MPRETPPQFWKHGVSLDGLSSFSSSGSFHPPRPSVPRRRWASGRGKRTQDVGRQVGSWAGAFPPRPWPCRARVCSGCSSQPRPAAPASVLSGSTALGRALPRPGQSSAETTFCSCISSPAGFLHPSDHPFSKASLVTLLEDTFVFCPVLSDTALTPNLNAACLHQVKPMSSLT